MTKRRLNGNKKPFPLEGYLFAAINRIWQWWPPRKEILKYSELEGGHICELCGKVIPTTGKGRKKRRGVQVDHIDPVVPLTGFQGWDTHIARKFVPKEKLQVLCKPCHQKKTNEENEERRVNGKESNENSDHDKLELR